MGNEFGMSASLDPDSLVDTLDEFLNGSSPQAVRFREKLAKDGSQEKHAFLAIDSSVSDWWSMSNWDEGQTPGRLPKLPPEIVRVWVAGQGRRAWSCSREGPWQAHSVDGLP